MKINDRFEIITDRHNFIVLEAISIDPGHRYSKGKNTSKTTAHYFTTLIQACQWVLNKSIKTESLETVVESIGKATDEITAAIDKRRDTPTILRNNHAK